jgi:hypothetical protein
VSQSSKICALIFGLEISSCNVWHINNVSNMFTRKILNTLRFKYVKMKDTCVYKQVRNVILYLNFGFENWIQFPFLLIDMSLIWSLWTEKKKKFKFQKLIIFFNQIETLDCDCLHQ